jgi:hypothetical protein
MVVSTEALGGNTMSETTLHQLAKGFGALLIRSKVRTVGCARMLDAMGKSCGRFRFRYVAAVGQWRRTMTPNHGAG